MCHFALGVRETKQVGSPSPGLSFLPTHPRGPCEDTEGVWVTDKEKTWSLVVRGGYGLRSLRVFCLFLALLLFDYF